MFAALGCETDSNFRTLVTSLLVNKNIKCEYPLSLVEIKGTIW